MMKNNYKVKKEIEQHSKNQSFPEKASQNRMKKAKHNKITRVLVKKGLLSNTHSFL